MVAFEYSSLDINNWYKGGPNQCPCFLSGPYTYKLPLHGINGPLLTFSERRNYIYFEESCSGEHKIFVDALPKSDVRRDGKQEISLWPNPS